MVSGNLSLMRFIVNVTHRKLVGNNMEPSVKSGALYVEIDEDKLTSLLAKALHTKSGKVKAMRGAITATVKP